MNRNPSEVCKEHSTNGQKIWAKETSANKEPPTQKNSDPDDENHNNGNNTFDYNNSDQTFQTDLASFAMGNT
jgi:hypothetical protein